MARDGINEAAGDLTDNDDLKREGKVDRAAGATKETVDEAAEKLNEARILLPATHRRRRSE